MQKKSLQVSTNEGKVYVFGGKLKGGEKRDVFMKDGEGHPHAFKINKCIISQLKKDEELILQCVKEGGCGCFDKCTHKKICLGKVELIREIK
ncbi:MAG: hypothetical protein WC499_04245 [Patescibacteria group bacterium]